MSSAANAASGVRTIPTIVVPMLEVSIVVPVYDEEAVLPALCSRLYPVLDGLGTSYEVIFVDDGSRDRSAALLADRYDARPDVTRVVVFTGNFGQHMAVLAGFAHAKGRFVVTIDADLQNPPEEIPRVVAALAGGADYVGTVRENRRDAAWRRWASGLMNRIRERTTGLAMRDQGCMLRGYHRTIVDLVNACPETTTFVPALAYSFARAPREITIEHAPRAAGRSKYTLSRLMRLSFDLITGFAVVPMYVFALAGVAVSCASLVGILAAAAAAQGLLALLFAAFLLIGIALVGIGILGEYVVRIDREVRRRPRYVIRTTLGATRAERAEHDHVVF
jgi:undecaprenyl-phosphate 4-deoxy-4-formamido-L-arabinose transferase